MKRTEEGWTWRICCGDDREKSQKRFGRVDEGWTNATHSVLPHTPISSLSLNPASSVLEVASDYGKRMNKDEGAMSSIFSRKEERNETHQDIASAVRDLPRSSLSAQAAFRTEVGTS